MNKLTNTLLAGMAALGLTVTSVVWASPAAAAAAQANTVAAAAQLPAQVAVPATLTPGEIAGLTFMREEEKLARDVYLTLDDAWDLQVFANIARSEQTHMDAIGTLLTRYGIADPAAGNERGRVHQPRSAGAVQFTRGAGRPVPCRRLAGGCDDRGDRYP